MEARYAPRRQRRRRARARQPVTPPSTGSIIASRRPRVLVAAACAFLRRLPRAVRDFRDRPAAIRSRPSRRRGSDRPSLRHGRHCRRQNSAATWAIASTSRIWPRNWLPSPSPSGRAAHQPGDVDEFQLRRHDLGRFGKPCADREPFVRHRDAADIRLDRAKWIVRRLGRRSRGQRVEQGRLADIRQPDDAAAEPHRLSATGAGCRFRRAEQKRRATSLIKRVGRAREQQRDRLGHRVDQRFDPKRHLVAGEILQHIRLHQFLNAGMPDPDPHPPVIRSEMGVDRAQSVVPGAAAAALDP